MPTHSDKPGDAVSDDLPPRESLTKTRRPRFQVRLRTLLLATAAVAVWFQVWQNSQRIEHLRSRIEAAKPLARELTISDPAEIAVVERAELWYDQNEWDLYLPEGKYRLNLATREVSDSEFAPVVKSVALSPGRHRISIEERELDDRWQVIVQEDGQDLMVAEEPAEWHGSGGSTGAGHFSSVASLDSHQPVVLFRRRFTVKEKSGNSFTYATPKGPANGVLLWIERIDGERPKSAR